jgi:hypothetical protein
MSWRPIAPVDPTITAVLFDIHWLPFPGGD